MIVKNICNVSAVTHTALTPVVFLAVELGREPTEIQTEVPLVNMKDFTGL